MLLDKGDCAAAKLLLGVLRSVSERLGGSVEVLCANVVCLPHFPTPSLTHPLPRPSRTLLLPIGSSYLPCRPSPHTFQLVHTYCPPVPASPIFWPA